MYIYDGLLDASVVDVQVAQITIPTGRTLQAKDILISSYETSVGALAQVVAIAGGVATVDFIGQISAGGGGTTLNKYTYSRPSDTNFTISSIYKRIINIIQQAKGKVIFSFTNTSSFAYSGCAISCPTDTSVIISATHISSNIVMLKYRLYIDNSNNGAFDENNSYIATLNTGDTMNGNIQPQATLYPFSIVYYNDTEIT